MAKSSAVEGRIKHPSKVIFSTLPGKLHIVTEMVSMVQRKKEFWTVLNYVRRTEAVFGDIR